MTQLLEIKKKVKSLSKNLEKIYGDDFYSLFLFGSASSGDFTPESDINALVILSKAIPLYLAKSQPHIKRWKKELKSLPIFFDPSTLRWSALAYPLEMSEIIDNHQVIHGHDYLSELKIDSNLLLWCCHRELLEIILALNKELLETKTNKLNPLDLAFKSINPLIFVLRGIMRAKGKVPSKIKSAILDEFGNHTQHPLPSAKIILKMKAKEIALPNSYKDDMDVFNSYLKEMHGLEEVIRS